MEIGLMISNIGWSIFEKVGRIAINVIIGIWIARELGPNDYGIYSYSLAFLSGFTVLSAVGLNGNSVLTSEITKAANKEEKLKYLKISVYISVICSIMSIALSLLAAKIILGERSELIKIIAIMSMAFLFKPLEAFRLWYEVNGMNAVLSKTSLLTSLGLTIIRLYVLVNGANLQLLSYVVVLEGAAIGCAIYIHATKTKLINLENIACALSEVKKYFVKSMSVVLIGIGIVFHSKIDQVMLGNIADISQLGNYSAVARISEMLYFIPLTVMTVASPILIMQKNNVDNYYKITEAITRIFLFISIAYSLIMMIFGNAIMGFVYGPNFEIDKNLTIAYAMAGPFVFMGVVSNNHLIINGKYLRAAIYSFSCGLVIIVLGGFLYKYYQAIGMASSVVISQCLIYFFGDLVFKDSSALFFIKLKAVKNIYKLNEAIKVVGGLKYGAL
jgi:polysaccharide transporter, PST family